jgi:lipopolysaccharide transport system permease protein
LGGLQSALESGAWLWLPIVLLIQLTLMLGTTMLLSMAHFLWRDVGSATTFLMQIWFYVTPIVYPLSQVPKEYHIWFLFNPLACLVLFVQNKLLGVGVPIGTSFALLVWTLVLGVGGIWFFRTMKTALGEAL